MLNVTYIWR